MATRDPATLPDKTTWYPITNLAHPASIRATDSPHPVADLTELVELYGIRHWVEQGCKQIKDEMGWADFQTRSDIAIRRHQYLAPCAFSFCWQSWFDKHTPHSQISWLRTIRAVRG